MRKNIALISLLLVVFFSVIAVANATVNASEYIEGCMAEAVRSSGNKVTITIDITGKDIMDVLGAQTIVIQEQTPGSSRWTSVATMTSDEYSNMLGYNKRQHIADISYYGAKSGYSYRAKVYFYAEKGGYDTREFITASVK